MNILSYNIYCRPRQIFWDNQIVRAKQLAQSIIEYEYKYYTKIDVLFLQEVFDNKANDILKETLHKAGYIHKTKRDKKCFKVNGGGLIYSRFPIIEQGNMVYEKAQIFNVAAAKGMNYAKIVKRGKVYNCFNIHLDSFDEKFRLENMKQMKEYIESKTNDKENIIIGGDFNIDMFSEEINNVFSVFDYYIPRVDYEISNSTISNRNSWIKRRITTENDADDKEQFIDFFISNMSASMRTIEFKFKQVAHDIAYSPPFFLNIYKWKKELLVEDLSDHFGILGQFH